jgi:hypothetical protein
LRRRGRFSRSISNPAEALASCRRVPTNSADQEDAREGLAENR